MATYDLAAARLARAEERGDPKSVAWDGVDYPLLPEMPADTLALLQELKVIDALRSLFVDPSAAGDFIARARPSLEDVMDLIDQVYRFDPGESDASEDSSETAPSKPSRRTSKGSTD